MPQTAEPDYSGEDEEDHEPVELVCPGCRTDLDVEFADAELPTARIVSLACKPCGISVNVETLQ